MKILARLEKSRNYWFLLSVLFLFFLFRLPSLFEPYWYGDEGIYQVVGMGINNDRLLYRDIWDNKPPLLYMLYSLFSSDQFMLRLVSLIFGLLSVIAFFNLAKTLFENKKIVFVSTSFFALFFGIPIIEGNIANAENFMLLPIILSAFLIFKLNEGGFKKFYNITLFSSGLLLSAAFLFKIVGIFEFTAFLLFLLFINYKKQHFFALIKKIYPFLLGFFVPIASIFLFFFIKGAFSDFYSAVFMQNIGYVGYGNKLLIPQGLLIIKIIILAGFILFLFKKRSLISPTTMFILLWFLFSTFSTFFAQRPYTHYLLMLLPSFSLMIGLIFFDRKYSKLLSVLFICVVVLVLTNFKLFNRNIAYYQNFLSLITNQKTVTAYQKFFDRQTPVDYQLVQFIKSRIGNDNIFIWGNNAQVYKLVNKLPPGKFIVAYHISMNNNNINETKTDLEKTKPKFIIVTDPNNPIPYGLIGYKQWIGIGKSTIYERLF
ncbi:MAG: glycosyltransferase family 39 protein [Patescibacteria group bacterium]|nr:glycosyltransferase family 39 protein [Patescibacteria group bacterium]